MHQMGDMVYLPNNQHYYIIPTLAEVNAANNPRYFYKLFTTSFRKRHA